MYCSSCGVAVTPALSYCNYCGAKLTGVKDENVSKSSEVKPEMLVAAMVFVFVFGLAAITALMGMMKVVLHFDAGQILAFILMSFLILLLIEGACLRLLFRRKRNTEESADIGRTKGPATRELDAAPEQVLREPMPSVTEHTTRAFDPVYNKRDNSPSSN